jgi:hypothetical protein
MQGIVAASAERKLLRMTMTDYNHEPIIASLQQDTCIECDCPVPRPVATLPTFTHAFQRVVPVLLAHTHHFAQDTAR